MNYTENYHLPQWEETDRVMRTDFNDAMASIESGMSGNAQAATAAMAEAVKLPYAVGSYTGNGSSQDVNVGFRPRFVLICGDQKHNNIYYGGLVSIMAGANINSERLFMTDNGFWVEVNTANVFPRINESGKTYEFIAFR